MYKTIAAILFNVMSLVNMNVAVAADEANAGECTVICSLPAEGTSAD